MLREAGYAQRADPRELLLVDEAGGVEFFYLRPRDIAVYVGEGTLDLGITGRDMLLDSGAPATEVMPLGFGRSRFRFAAPNGGRMSVEDLHDLRLATSYPGLVGSYLKERGVITRLIALDGAVETAIRLGVADAIADVVETGTTLRQAGLELFGDPILESEAVLIRRARSERSAGPAPAGAPAQRRPGGAQLRDDGLRRQRRVRRGGLRHHPGAGVADGVAAGQTRLARGPGHGPAGGCPADHGRSVESGCPGHPGHRHRRMPSVAAEPFLARPHRLRILVVIAVAALLILSAVFWIAMPSEIRALFTLSQRLTLLAVLGALVLIIVAAAASYVRADADGLRFRNGLRTHQVPWARVHKILLRRGDPWAQLLLTPADGGAFEVDLDAEKRQLMGIQAGDGVRAQQAVEELRSRHQAYRTGR